MKKVLALILAVCLCLTLCACGSEESSKSTTTAASGEATTATPVKSDMKAGFICQHDENSTYDLVFINAAKEACAQLGIECIIKTKVPEDQECYNTAAELVDVGCTYIFADSFGHEDYMIQAAKEFPEVQFAHATGTKAHTENLPNYHNVFASIYEGRYLAGVAAGMKLNALIEAGEFAAEDAKIGYIGAFTYAEVISGYTSFYLGARSICPTATMEVTFTGSWYDETAEKEAANKLIQNGCKLISQHADSMGAPTACEAANIPNVSYNGSTVAAAPNTFVVSTSINWTPFFVYSIGATMKGESFETDWCGTLDTNSIIMTEINDNAAAAGTAEKLEEVMAGLKDGSIKVFDTSKFTVKGETLTSYMADVNTDADYTPDTEAIADGYFHESEFRSAPYFDLQIDGITLLDTQF